MTLTKAVIAERIYIRHPNLTQSEAKEFIEVFFKNLSDAIVVTGELKLSGFGNFKCSNKKARPGRNPKTGESIPVTARRVCTFKPGGKLRDRCVNFDGEILKDDFDMAD